MARIRLARVAHLVGFYPDPEPYRSPDVVALIECLLERQSKHLAARSGRQYGTTQRERLRLRIPLAEAR